jgi:hypothetical protein
VLGMMGRELPEKEAEKEAGKDAEKEAETGKQTGEEMDAFSEALLQHRMAEANRWILLSPEGTGLNPAMKKTLELALKLADPVAARRQAARTGGDTLSFADFMLRQSKEDGARFPEQPTPFPEDGETPGDAVAADHSMQGMEKLKLIIPDVPLPSMGLRATKPTCEEISSESTLPTAEAPLPPAGRKVPLYPPLTNADLRKLARVREYDSPRRVRSGLVLSWDAGESEPDPYETGVDADADRPDFGFDFARWVVERRQAGAVPEGDAFQWIRDAVEVLEAEGGRETKSQEGEKRPDERPDERPDDAGPMAVRRARELHDGPHTRHVLQAALISTDATLDGVADMLGFDRPVVDAYANLFFNVIGRRRDSVCIQRILDQVGSGRDPVSSGTVPKPYAGLLAAAADLTLGQVVQAGGCNMRKTPLQELSRIVIENLLARSRCWSLVPAKHGQAPSPGLSLALAMVDRMAKATDRVEDLDRVGVFSEFFRKTMEENVKLMRQTLPKVEDTEKGGCTSGETE